MKKRHNTLPSTCRLMVSLISVSNSSKKIKSPPPINPGSQQPTPMRATDTSRTNTCLWEIIMQVVRSKRATITEKISWGPTINLSTSFRTPFNNQTFPRLVLRSTLSLVSRSMRLSTWRATTKEKRISLTSPKVGTSSAWNQSSPTIMPDIPSIGSPATASTSEKQPWLVKKK